MVAFNLSFLPFIEPRWSRVLDLRKKIYERIFSQVDTVKDFYFKSERK